MSTTQFRALSQKVGTWVSEREYAALFGLSAATLANHRALDKRAGRTSARPGFPIYRKIGGSIRYLVSEHLMNASESATAA